MRPCSRKNLTYRSQPLPPRLLAELNSTQQKIEGFHLPTYQAAHVVLIGAGGIGSQVASALNRKGLGRQTILDDDVVETKNLTRQLYDRHDVGKNKALQLGRHLTRDGLFPTEIRSVPLRFQEFLHRDDALHDASVIICGVDNNPTRRAVTEYALQRRLPVIHAAVSRDGNSMYVMLQEPGAACWGCVFPTYLNDDAYPCNLPGIIDVLQVVSGLVVYSVDSILCGRARLWNVRQIYLDGALPDRARTIQPRRGCALCTAYNIWTACRCS
jgi:molybdopterin/thiamine biosynthesis adenylyltransferase